MVDDELVEDINAEIAALEALLNEDGVDVD